MAAATTAAVTAATSAASAASAATRQRGIGLDHRQNRRERGDGNAHAACDAEAFHSPPTPTDRRRSDGCERIMWRRDPARFLCPEMKSRLTGGVRQRVCRERSREKPRRHGDHGECDGLIVSVSAVSP
jgi:hypothetical protein